MHKESYSAIHTQYPFANFEAIIDAFSLHFPQLINLSVLNAELAKQDKGSMGAGGAGIEAASGSYLRFFAVLMRHLEGSSATTPAEVVRALYALLATNDEVKSFIQNHFIIVPPQEGKPSPQLGFLEHTAVGTLAFPQPLSFLDMLRAVSGLDELLPTITKKLKSGIGVLQLADLPCLDLSALKSKEGINLINLNKNPKQAAKWAVVQKIYVVHYRGPSGLTLVKELDTHVHCEMPLSEREKRELELAFGPVQGYHHRKGHCLESTGYSALACAEDLLACTLPEFRAAFRDKSSRLAEKEYLTGMLEKEPYAPIMRANADFASTLHDFLQLQCAGDVPGRSLTLEPGEQKYCTPEFLTVADSHFLDERYRTTRRGISADSTQLHAGLAFHFLATIAALGRLPSREASVAHGEQAITWRPGDIQSAMHALVKEGLAHPDAYMDQYNQSVVTLIPGLVDSLKSKLQKFSIVHQSDLRATDYRYTVLREEGTKSTLLLPVANKSSGVSLWIQHAFSPKFGTRVEKNNLLMNAFAKATHCSIGPDKSAALRGKGEARYISGRDLVLAEPNALSLRGYQATLFFTFIRACCQQQCLVIDTRIPDHIVYEGRHDPDNEELYGKPLPFELTAQELALAITLFDENTHLHFIAVPADSRSLITLQKAILPVLGRNRWLYRCGYQPALIDDSWRQLARYWLTYLGKEIHLLDDELMQHSAEASFFKECVKLMGVKGLQKVLAMLASSSERKELERIFEAGNAAFFTDCQSEETAAYLSELSAYLQTEAAYFPFTDLSLPYTNTRDALTQMTAICSSLNSSTYQLQHIIIRDAALSPEGGLTLIRALAAKAHAEHWCTFIVFPELAKDNNAKPQWRALSLAYRMLNNVIITNRQALFKAEQVLHTAHARPSNSKGAPLGAAGAGAAFTPAETGAHPPLLTRALRALEHLDADSAWPLVKKGGVSLQIQQQQELANERSLLIEQAEELSLEDELISDEWVSIDTIHKHPALLDLLKEINPSPAFMSLNDGRLHPLQNLFTTWIGKKKAPEVIGQMTVAAASVLLRHYQKLASGLAVDNLPKGFFLQRASQGHLLLAYSLERAATQKPNPLALRCEDELTRFKPWLGDFRQFEITRYLGDAMPMTNRDWQWLTLYAFLQPHKDKEEHAKEFKSFVALNPSLATALVPQEQFIAYWPVFMQLWNYQGEEAIALFLSKPATELLPAFDAALITRVLAEQSDALQAFITPYLLKTSNGLNNLRGLAYVRHLHGDKGLALLLQYYQKIEEYLGADALQVLLDALPDKKCTYSLDNLMKPEFFAMVDKMVATLGDNPSRLNAWINLVRMHRGLIEVDSLMGLWDGFCYFVDELNEMNLNLAGDEFQDMPCGNGLTLMSRMLSCLRHIPDPKLQKEFLTHFKAMDTHHTGVHYALAYEGFHQFDPSLELRDFKEGNPTYGVAPHEHYRTLSSLEQRRTLAQCARDKDTYKALQSLLALPEASTGAAAGPKEGKEQQKATAILTLLLHSKLAIPLTDAAILFNDWPEDTLKSIARAVHSVAFKKPEFKANLDALIRLAPLLSAKDGFLRKPIPNGAFPPSYFDEINQKYPGILFDVVTHLNGHRLDEGAFSALLEQITKNMLKTQDMLLELDYEEDSSLFQKGYQLASVFLVSDYTRMDSFFKLFLIKKRTKGYEALHLKPLPSFLAHEIDLLFAQILSLDYAKSEVRQLTPVLWDKLQSTIERMMANPAESETLRRQLIESYCADGLSFTYSAGGGFKRITELDADKPKALAVFKEKEGMLWQLCKDHIALPADEDSEQALSPLLKLLRAFHASKTYVCELDQFISILKKIPKDHYYSAPYLYELLMALQPVNREERYPFPMLKVLLEQALFQAQPLDKVDKKCPEAIKGVLQTIARHPLFDTEQKGLLCAIATKEQQHSGQVRYLPALITLAEEQCTQPLKRAAVLAYMASADAPHIKEHLERVRALMQLHTRHSLLDESWPKTSALWLDALSHHDEVQALLAPIIQEQQSTPDSIRPALIAHILAFSGLQSVTSAEEAYQEHALLKSKKLLTALSALSLDDLVQLAHYYLKAPFPTADEVLHALKKQKAKGQHFSLYLNLQLSQPKREPIPDHAALASTRELDFKRLLLDARRTQGTEQRPLNSSEMLTLTKAFALLKALEEGSKVIALGSAQTGTLPTLSQMELAQALAHYAQKKPQSPQDIVTIIALLSAALGRTSGKYPHLAQQFALLSNALLGSSPSAITQCATGEGKSHLIALHAALYASQGMSIDVCTAKRSLAMRDNEDYQPFFNYLGLKSIYLHAGSEAKDYSDCPIHYSTLGDVSLFLDKECYKGTPITRPREQCRLIIDEVDAGLREGVHIQYNYAKPTGRTPSQMMWFYKAINEFYETQQRRIEHDFHGLITLDLLKELQESLVSAAANEEDRLLLIQPIIEDPLRMVRWVHAAHEAHHLREDKDFTVIRTEVRADKSTYHLREIVPLSADNQKVMGSTFSDGVHQLLAVHLNTLAAQKGEPEEMHVHLESDIISSRTALQRIEELWGAWEGFTGTVSPLQAAQLSARFKTQILTIPTNLPDLRQWEPVLCADEVARERQLVLKIKEALSANKSILIACKDDLQTKHLEQVLHRMNTAVPPFFTALEMNSLLVYTASDTRSPEMLLTEKRTKEEWRLGKKQRGVCLIASGFGRGDNLGVDEVFVLDAVDINDLLQKGGRTARNGAEGKAYYFCLHDNLAKEEEVLKSQLKDYAAELEPIVKALGLTEASDEYRFKRVMAMRELLAQKETQLQEHYWYVRALYSAWGMSYLGATHAHPKEQEQLTHAFSESLQQLDEKWLVIAHTVDLSAEEKINAIKEVLSTRITDDFTRRYNQTVRTLGLPLAVATYNLSTEHLAQQGKIATRVDDKNSLLRDDLATVCTTLVSLKGVAEEDTWTTELGRMLANPAQLHQLALKAPAITSKEQWRAALSDVLPTEAEALPITTQAQYSPYRIAQRLSDEPAERLELQRLMASVLEAHPQQGMALLTQWEGFAKSLDQKSAKAFLRAFCQVLARARDKEIMLMSRQLLTKTQQFWHKDMDGSYQPMLVNLWQALAATKDDLPVLVPYINNLLTYRGKGWLHLLNASLSLGSSILLRHHERIKTLIEAQWASAQKKSAKIELISQYLQGLQWIYEAIERHPEARDLLLEQLSRLDQASFQWVLAVMCIRHDALRQQGDKLVRLFMAQLHQGMPLSEVKQFSNAVFKVMELAQEKPSVLTAILNYLDAPHLIDKHECARILALFEEIIALFGSTKEFNKLVDEVQLRHLFHALMSQNLRLEEVCTQGQMILNTVRTVGQNPQTVRLFLDALCTVAESKPPTNTHMIRLLCSNAQALMSKPHLLTTVLTFNRLELPIDQVESLSALLLGAPASASDEAFSSASAFLEHFLSQEEYLRQIKNLPAERFDWLCRQLNTAELRIVIGKASVLPLLLIALADPEMECTRLNQLLSLLTAAQHSAVASPEHSERIMQLFTRTKELLFKTQNSTDFASMMRRIKKNLVVLLHDETIIPALVGWINKPLTLPEASLMTQVLVDASQLVNVCRELMNTLISTLEFISGLSEPLNRDVLSLFAEHISPLMTNPTLLEECTDYCREGHDLASITAFMKEKTAPPKPISDKGLVAPLPQDNGQAKKPAPLSTLEDTESYLKSLGAEEEALYRAVIDQFNTAKASSATQWLLNNTLPPGHRSILMRLLYRGSLLTDADAPLHQVWTAEQNTDLFKKGLSHYSKRTKHILSLRNESQPAQVRSLTTTQQQALLTLAEEMSFIAGTGAIPPTPLALKSDLMNYAERYRANWFKSTKREKQLDKALERINAAPNYLMVLEAINNAKLEAMLEDREEDKHRFFKINRSGQSRLFKTLGLMEDAVLKHWVEHADVVGFSEYKEFAKTKFNRLVHLLKTRIIEYDNELDTSVVHFFTRKHDKARLLLLKDTLECEVPNEGAIPLANLPRIINAIQQSMLKLPGHLAVLAREVEENGAGLISTKRMPGIGG